MIRRKVQTIKMFPDRITLDDKDIRMLIAP